MPTDTKLNNLIINYLTQEQYNAIATPNENELYLTPDNSTGGGGKSVSPCLNLMDFSGENTGPRTSITEEEYNNIKKGLYNSVLYADLSTNGGEYGMYFPETSLSSFGDFSFSAYDISVDEASNALTISSSSLYAVHIGEKSADGTYPIVITKDMTASFGGGGGSSTPPTSLSFQDVTVSELANHVGEFGNFHITDLKIALTDTPITGAYFSGIVGASTSLQGGLWISLGSDSNQLIYLGNGGYAIKNGVIKGGKLNVGSFNAIRMGELNTLSSLLKFNSSIGADMLSRVPDEGNFAYIGTLEDNNGFGIAICSSSAVNLSATGEETYCKFIGLFREGKGIGCMEMKKGANDIPQFKSFTTWLPPVTSADEGKSLVIKNGNAQWTDLTSIHNHTIVIKEGSKIIFAANKDLASATPATTLETLISTFKDTTTAGFGDYILLTVDTTAKLTKQDGTETDLSTLTVTISDTVK